MKPVARYLGVIATVLVLLASSSCSSNEQIVRSSLLDGSWTYNVSNKSQSDLVFYEDGTFVGTQSGSGIPLSSNGRGEWKVEGTTLTLCFTGCVETRVSADVTPNGSFFGEGVDENGKAFAWSLLKRMDLHQFGLNQ